MTNIKSIVKEFTDEYKINLSNDTVLVAFSGGYDSMCLIHVLKSLNCKKLVAIHLNHNWRGKESVDDEENCRNFCKNHCIEFYSENIENSVKKTETDAREARYEFYEKCAQKFKTSFVFMAHNANDNAETVLYRITKGTGIHGLCGIQPHRDIYYRPLLNVTRTDIEEYCKINKLTPNIDSSNNDTKYNRNFIRHKVLPTLETINTDVINAINSLSSIANEYRILMEDLTKDIGNSTQALIALPAAGEFYVLKELLLNYNLEYDRKKIEAIRDFIQDSATSKSGKKYSLSNNLFLYANKNFYKVIEATVKNTEEIHVKNVGTYKFANQTLIIKKCTQKVSKFPEDKQKKIYVSVNDIDYTIRTRRDGDIISPLGMTGSQKLKKYLNEKKIPEFEKDKILLLCQGNEVFWVSGYGISEKIKVTDNPTHVIYIEERLDNCEKY